MENLREEPDLPYDPVQEASEESFPASDSPAWGGGAPREPAPPPHPAPVTDNEPLLRFETRDPEGVAFLDYRLGPGPVITLVHTEVPASLRGRGLAGRLARAALESARERRLRVIPLCPFVLAYLRRHPEFAPLLHP